jgi:hypothetical protein
MADAGRFEQLGQQIGCHYAPDGPTAQNLVTVPASGRPLPRSKENLDRVQLYRHVNAQNEGVFVNTFKQITDPLLGSPGPLPSAQLFLLLLFILLGVFRVICPRRPWPACCNMVLAVVGWQMPLWPDAQRHRGRGPLWLIPFSGSWSTPRGLYKPTVATKMVCNPALAPSPTTIGIWRSRDQPLFRVLMEAPAGFGAPVAISAATLIAVGMKPKAAMASAAGQHRLRRVRRYGCADHRVERCHGTAPA